MNFSHILDRLDCKKLLRVAAVIVVIGTIAYTVYAFSSHESDPDERESAHDVIQQPEPEPEITPEPDPLPIIDLSENVIEIQTELMRINEPTPWGREVLYSAGNSTTIDEPVFTQLYLYNMDTKEEKEISQTNIKFGELYEGRFNDEWIVWLDTNQGGQNEIYVMNRKTGETQKVKSCNMNKPQLRLAGDNLVWVEQKDPEQDRLYLYNFRSGEPISLESFTNATYGTCPPAISNNILVWVKPSEDDPENKSIIKWLDLSKALTVPVQDDVQNSAGDEEQLPGESADEELTKPGIEDPQTSEEATQTDGEDNKTDSNQDQESDEENSQTVEDDQHTGDSQQNDQEETDGEVRQMEAYEEQSVEPQFIDPLGFAIYPATNGEVVAWLDNLNPSEANLKMTPDRGRTIVDIDSDVGRLFAVGDKFVVYTKNDAIMLYFWDIDRYARITKPGEKGRLSKDSVHGNTIVWYDANNPNQKKDTVKLSIVEQP